jgi:DNA helicase II / ATP-dependent DNA helicase PcrA
MARVYTLKTTRAASRLGIDYAAQLNGEQRDVAFAPKGPLLVLAGAGSGKTRALTYRVARLIDTGVPAEGIVLLTFTNRAAREMLSRVEELCGATARRIFGGTFHHVGNTILRRHAEVIGYGPNFNILDRDDSREVMGAAVVDAGVQVQKGRFPTPDVLLEVASYAINTQTPARQVIAKRAPRFHPLADDIAAVCRAYIERKASMNLMDFDDLLMNWKVLLEESGPVGEEISRGCHAILVDEYQDTNTLQGQIVDLMARAHKNVTVVGDDAQCIYGFRGAAVENMLEFQQRWPAASILPLSVNYRSTPEIVALANATLARSTVGFQKSLHPIRKSGGFLPALVPCKDVHMQAEFVAQRILELRDEGTPLTDIAVLYRAHSHVIELQAELIRRGIPFVVRSGLRFFEQAHIKDVICPLKVLYNVDDELSFRRAVKLHEGVGNASADTLWHGLKGELTGAFRGLSDELIARLCEASGKRAQQGAKRFLALMVELAKPSMRARPGDMIRAQLELFYGDYLMRHFPNGADRQEEIAQLADYADGFADLETFLSELALVQDFSAEEPVAADDDEERVTLSSVHQAKGLEYSRVFLVWLTEGRFPSDLALRETGGAEEERRLFYVATTRARDELYLCYPQVHRSRDTSQVLLRRTRFIDELPPPALVPPEQGAPGELEGFYEVWQIHEEPLLPEEGPRLASPPPTAALGAPADEKPDA